jgi:hypothetical protein
MVFFDFLQEHQDLSPQDLIDRGEREQEGSL